MRRRNDQAQIDAENLTAARVILADPGRYGGLMHEWAARVLALLEKRSEAA